MKVFLFLSFVLFSFSCGDDDDNSSSPPPSKPPPSSTPAEVSFTRVKPVLAKSCGGGSCHTSGNSRDRVIVSSRNFLGSKACTLVRNLKMPKPGSPQAGAITDAERKRITDYCAAHKG